MQLEDEKSAQSLEDAYYVLRNLGTQLKNTVGKIPFGKIQFGKHRKYIMSRGLWTQSRDTNTVEI